MVSVVIRRRLWLMLCLLLQSLSSVYSQSANTANMPPKLANGEKWEGKLRLVYTESDSHFSVITVRFHINEKKDLDSLQVDGGPQLQKDSLRNQLKKLDGKWKLQSANGKPIKSKWLCFRWYISGFYGPSEDTQRQIWHEMKAAYTREESLFNCTSAWNKPYVCQTPFIEGHDYFWFPPFYSEVVR